MDKPDASFAVMTCNKCGRIESLTNPDFGGYDIQENAEQVINKIKEYFEQKGWRTSWGHDLCPSCSSKE